MELSLNLPAQYVDIEQEEMMYIDGGATYYSNWWGHCIKLTKAECRLLNKGTSLTAICATLMKTPASAIVAAAAGVVGVMAQIGAENNGLYLNSSIVGVFWISW